MLRGGRSGFVITTLAPGPRGETEERDRSQLGRSRLGATLAMVLADGLAIAVGALLHRRLPERLLHGLASVLFLLFGLWLLFDAALGWRWLAVVVTASAATVAAIIAIVVPLRSRLAARRAQSDPQIRRAACPVVRGPLVCRRCSK